MCGILGINKKASNSTEFEAANATLLHRGPDYTGTFEDEFLRMNHLLLAIRGDIQESVQPVVSKNGPWVLAFNGQLYNTDSIRRDLGNTPSSSLVDTVLLYALIQKFGWNFITRIQGMFAIALYNKDEKILKLYRDQSGQKNLYYTLQDGRFAFASEMKALVAFPFVRKEVDDLAVAVAASVGYIPGEKTLIAGINKLQPSEELTVIFEPLTIKSKLFISKGESEYGSLSPEDALTQTIADHLQSNRDISINLSGGLDSSLIFYESVKLGRSIHAFSTRFEGGEEKHNTDSILAERLAKDFNQRFTPISITKELYLENFVESYKAIEEPNYNISIPIYYQTAVTEGIHGAGLRVVLSGDGGDELFGGYPHYELIRNIATYKKFLTSYGVNFLKKLTRGDATDYGEISEIFLRYRSLPNKWMTKDVQSDMRSYVKATANLLLPPYETKHDDVYRAMLLDRFVWLASENFIRSDKLYMKESMEMRCPLAYTPLRTYMDERVPSAKYISSKSNKVFLRELYENKLPDYITKRKDKSGWRAPVELWYDRKYKDYFLEIISAVEHHKGCVDWKGVKQHIEKSEKWPGKAMHLYLSLAILLREYKLV